MAGGLAMVLIGVLVVTQVWSGRALERLGVVSS